MSDDKPLPFKAPPGSPDMAALFRHPVDMFSFGFGTGLIYPAPGTWGTLVGIPFFYLLMQAGALGLPLFATFVVVTIIAFIFGCWCCDVSAKRMGVHDHSGIVWDEVVGYLVTMLPTVWLAQAVMPGTTELLIAITAGFIVFRILDIIKPWPIKLVDRHVGGGFGIMADDILAGAEGAVLMALGYWLVGTYLV